MKQEEKKQLSKDKILKAAIKEFGTKNYESASLGALCNEHNISKGLIYHYFENKEALYLCCVKTCYDALVAYHHNEDYCFTDFQKDMNHYLTVRCRFLGEYPDYSHLFFSTIFQPPAPLKKAIKDLRKEFDAQNIWYFRNALKNITLRETITEDDAIEYFIIFQEMFNDSFQSKLCDDSDFNTLVEIHEIKLSKLLDLMMYGIAKETKTR